MMAITPTQPEEGSTDDLDQAAQSVSRFFQQSGGDFTVQVSTPPAESGLGTPFVIDMTGVAPGDAFILAAPAGSGPALADPASPAPTFEPSNSGADTTWTGDHGFLVADAFTSQVGSLTLVHDADMTVTTVRMDTDGDGVIDAKVSPECVAGAFIPGF